MYNAANDVSGAFSANSFLRPFLYIFKPNYLFVFIWIIYDYFIHIGTSSTATDFVAYYVLHRIFSSCKQLLTVLPNRTIVIITDINIMSSKDNVQSILIVRYKQDVSKQAPR